MKKDYLYCINENTCMHRRGCKRWIGNYTPEQCKEESNQNTFSQYVDDYDCMREDYDYDNAKHPFDMLDRFRSSLE